MTNENEDAEAGRHLGGHKSLKNSQLQQQQPPHPNMNPNYRHVFTFLFTIGAVSGRIIRGGNRGLANDANDALIRSYETSLSLLYEDSSSLNEADGSALTGTAWTAVEINSVPLIDDPRRHITVVFVDSQMYGSAGCNRYRGNIDALSQSSFDTKEFSITRRYCNDVMEQENGYMRFISSRTFFYEVVGASETDTSKVDELVLFDTSGLEGESVRGGILARFVKDDSAVLERNQ